MSGLILIAVLGVGYSVMALFNWLLGRELRMLAAELVQLAKVAGSPDHHLVINFDESSLKEAIEKVVVDRRRRGLK